MNFLRRYWPLLLLFALPVLFLADVWFGGQILFLRDYYWSEGVNRFYFGSSIRQGVFPFWNSLWQCGTPNAAQPYYGTFYPLNWIFVFPQVEWVSRVMWTFHIGLAAVSTYALARYWRLSVFPALFAGISFAYSAFFVALVEFVHSLTCIPWIPLALLLTSRIIDRVTREAAPAEGPRPGLWPLLRRNAGSIAGLAVVAALMILACPEYTYYSALLVAPYVAAKWIRSRNARSAGVSALFLAAAALLALCLAMPQLVLTYELVGHSIRAGEVDALIQMSSAHPRHWLMLLLPFLYGRPGYPNTYWAPTIYEFTYGALYVGILPLIALFFCWLRGKDRPENERRFLVWFLVAAATAGLVMAAGKFTPVYAFLHHWLPGLDRLRFPTKFYLFVTLALSLLGGFGLQSLLDNGGRAGRAAQRLWWIAAGAGGLFFAGYLLSLLHDGFLPWLMAHPAKPTALQINAELLDYSYAVAFSLMGIALFGMLAFGRGKAAWVQAGIVAVAFGNMWLISRQMQPIVADGIYTKRPETLAKWIGHNPQYRFLSSYWNAQQYIYGDTRPGVYEWARESGGSNYVLLEGISSLETGSMVLARYQQMYEILLAAPPAVQARTSDLLALRYIATGAPFQDVLWKNAPSDIKFIERKNCLPRAFLVPGWRFKEGEEPVLKTLLDPTFDPRREAVLEPLPGHTAPETDTTGGGEVRKLEDRGNALSLEVTAQGRALLVLGDTWYPGWSVTVDGMRQPIYRANYLFRGVFLEPGTHRVEFVYTPTHFAGALWICAAALVAVGCLGVLAGIIRRAPAASSPHPGASLHPPSAV